MNKTFVLSAISLALMSGCSQTVPHSDTAQVAPLTSLAVSPNDERAYRTLRLDNNIDVILVSDPNTDKSAAALNVGVGLLQDPMTQQGMAHYLEHLLFLGTDKFPDPNEYKEFLSQNGGVSNASTWLTYTNYMFKVNNDAFDSALDRFSDFFKGPKLYPEYTEKEKSAVNAEWSMRRELDFFGQFKLSRQMMGDHPANRFLIGNLETLGDKEGSNLHQETVAFYDKYYSSNIMKVALVSNLPLEEMEALAIKHFSAIKDKQIEKPTVTDPIDFSQLGGQKIYYKPNKDVKQVKLDFTIENNQDQFKYKPNYFVSYLLGSEMPGSPTQILKEKGWISSALAGASPNLFGNYGELSVTINLTDAGLANRDEVVALYMQYLDLIKAQGVDEKYFQEIQTSLDNEFKFLQKEDEFRYVSKLVNSMQDYPTNYAINAPYYYGAFNAEAINQVLSQLTPERLRVWHISREEKVENKQHFYAGEYRIEPIAAEEFATWSEGNRALNLPQVNRLMPESFALKTQASEQTLPKQVIEADGIELWHYPSQHFAAQPKGVLNVELNAGEANQDITTNVVMALWADLYSLQQSLLLAEAEAAGISVDVKVDNGLRLSLDGFTDKQGQLLDELLLGLSPKVDQARFEQAKDRYVRGLYNQQKQFVMYQLFPALRKVARAAQFEDSALIAAAEQLDLDTYQSVLADLLQHNQPRVFAFGNYDQSDLQGFSKQLSQALGQQHQAVAYFKTQRLEPKTVLSYQKDTAAADIGLLDVHFHPVANIKQRAIAKVFGEHFGHEIFNQLRTEEQLAYAVGGFDLPVDEYAGIAIYIQSPVMDLVQAQARFDRFKKEYAALLDGVTEEQFEAIKQGVMVNLTQDPKNMAEELKPILSDWHAEKWQYDSKAQLIAAVEQVTLADLKAFYQQTLANPDAARVNVQLRGARYQDKPFAELKGQTAVKDVAELKGKVTYQK